MNEEKIIDENSENASFEETNEETPAKAAGHRESVFMFGGEMAVSK